MINRATLPPPNNRRGSNISIQKTTKVRQKVVGELKPLNEFDMETTPVYNKLEEAYDSKKYTIAVLEGGSRSSKTHSIIQFLIRYAQNNRGKTKRVLIARQKATWTSATVMHDFINVLKFYKLFRQHSFNKTSKIYRLWDTEFWFGGLDDDQKLHGFQSDIFWINEAVEATKDDFDQLEMRLKGFGILDYNPSAEEHWIYDSVCSRPDAIYIHSTMLDNPFIAEKSRNKILSYEPTEENYKNGTADKNKWDIYGLGLRSKIEGVVFTNWDMVKEIPLYVSAKGKHRYGLDLGFEHDPTAIMDIYWSGNEIWVDEVCYNTHMLSSHIGKKLIDNGLKTVKGWAESVDGRTVEEVSRMGINIHKVKKQVIIAGINILKEYKIHFTERSVNMIKEAKNYKWMQDKNGKWLNEPIDDFNHGWDAIRYVATMEFGVKMVGSTADKVKRAIAGLR